MRETGRDGFKSAFIQNLKDRFPGCEIIHNDPGLNYQGIPDLLVLYKTHWAMFEVKARRTSPKRPNQDYYIELFDGLSFAAFVYPENEQEVLDDLQRAFQTRRTTRVPQR